MCKKGRGYNLCDSTPSWGNIIRFICENNLFNELSTRRKKTHLNSTINLWTLFDSQIWATLGKIRVFVSMTINLAIDTVDFRGIISIVNVPFGISESKHSTVIYVKIISENNNTKNQQTSCHEINDQIGFLYLMYLLLLWLSLQKALFWDSYNILLEVPEFVLCT